MTDLDKALARLHAKTPITLRRHELLTLATLADREADRYLARSRRKNTSAYTSADNSRIARDYQRLASEIRTQANA